MAHKQLASWPKLGPAMAVAGLFGLDLVVLMATGMDGSPLHMWLGILAAVLFIAHQWLNRAWWQRLRQGAYTPLRRLETCLVFSIGLLLVAQVAVGCVLWPQIEPVFRPDPALATAHLVIASWLFVLAFVHAGLQSAPFVRQALAKGRENGSERRAGRLLLLCLVLLGLWCFWLQDVGGGLFGHALPYLAEVRTPFWLLLCRYLAVAALFFCAGWGLFSLTLEETAKHRAAAKNR